ncbi:MAG: response regulator [Nitrospinota bacterium]
MEKIMIVDDDPNVSLLLEVTLKKDHHFDLVVCTSGEEALEMMKSEKPNLVLLDIMMPGIDGFEVCRRIKSSPETKFVSVIFLSSRREVTEKVKGMNIGADDYIVKPFDPDELLSRIKAQLRIRKLEKELIDKKKLETVLAMAVTLKHEINNPLTGILGNSEILKDWRNLKEEEVGECINDIHEQSKRIKTLVENLAKATNIVESTYIGDIQMIDVEESSKAK